MTKVLPGSIIIESEADSKCELCGAIAECRPYGPNGESICFDCGEKNPEVTQGQMCKHLLKAFYGEEELN